MSSLLFRLMIMLWPGVCTAVFVLIAGWDSGLTALLLKFIAFVYVVAAPAIFYALHMTCKERK